MNFTFSPPLFNGRDGSFGRFQSDLGIFAQLHSWTEGEKLLYLPLCLTGLARDAYESLEHGQRQSFSSVMEALRLSFAPVGVVEAHAKLLDLKFDPAERLETFLIRFKSAVRAALPGGDLERLHFTYFLSSLPAGFRSEVIAAGCESFEQAVNKTKCLLTARRASTAASGDTGLTAPSPAIEVRRVDEQGPLAKLLNRLEVLEAKVDQAIASPQPPVAHGPIGPCFACGQSGHIRADCRYGDATCHSCGKRGHIKPACRSKNAQPGERAAFSGTASYGGAQQ